MTDAGADGRSETATQHGARAPRPSRWRWLVLLAAVVVAAIVAVVLLADDDDEPSATDPPTTTTDAPDDAPEAGPVSEFTGTGDGTTDTFEVEDGWELRWESLGESLEVTLFTEAGESQGVILERQGSGSGSTYPPSGGSYYLEVAADGEWSIRIFQPAGD